MDKASGIYRVRTWVWLGLALMVVLVVWRLSISAQLLQHQQQQLHQRLLINRLVEHRLDLWLNQPQPSWTEMVRLSRYGRRPEEVDINEFLVLYLTTLVSSPPPEPEPSTTVTPPPLPLTPNPALQQALTQVSQQQHQLQQLQRRHQQQLSRLAARQQDLDAEWQRWRQQQQQHSDEITVVPLYIKTDPAHARVEILNITPRYVQGLALPSGRYLVQVSATGFNTSNRWLDLKPLSNRYCISLSPVDALQGPTPGQHQSAIFESTCVID